MPRHEDQTPGDADLLQGTLDMLLLKIAALRPNSRIRDGPANSADLERGPADSPGSLYPALYRLENRRWLKAEWKTTEGGREAKFYSLTKLGRRQLDAETMGWKRLCDAIALVLETVE